MFLKNLIRPLIPIFEQQKSILRFALNNGSILKIKLNQSYVPRASFSTKSPEFQNNKNDESEQKVPLLMDFVPRGMPNFLISVKNFFLINIILRQIDANFNFRKFVEGAKQALVLVSSHLANNRIEKLDGLIQDQALQEIKKNYQLLSVAQQRELEIKSSDVILSFTHHIDIKTLKEDFTGTRKHIVNFFLVFDCIPNLEETLRETAASQNKSSNLFKELSERKVICNYEFERQYIEGQDPSDWIITKLLHIKEKDLIDFIERV